MLRGDLEGAALRGLGLTCWSLAACLTGCVLWEVCVQVTDTVIVTTDHLDMTDLALQHLTSRQVGLAVSSDSR